MSALASGMTSSPRKPRKVLLTLRAARETYSLGDTGGVRLHDAWDDEAGRPEPDLTDDATVAAVARAARDVRNVELIHLALLLIGVAVLALAPLLRVR